MGQMLVRQLDDAKLARLKARAKSERTSAEALAREAIHQAAGGLSAEEKLALVREMQEAGERAKVPGVKQTPGWKLIREDRDHDH
jgi:plasmid stability protein